LGKREGKGEKEGKGKRKGSERWQGGRRGRGRGNGRRRGKELKGENYEAVANRHLWNNSSRGVYSPWTALKI